MDPAVTAAIATTLAIAALAALAIVGVIVWRSRSAARGDDDMLVLARLHNETAGRIAAMGNMLNAQHAELQRSVTDRLDAVSKHLGQSMQATSQQTSENLQKLNERLAVIDSAQKNITALATQVSSLQSVLGNKQQRGAFRQGRMEIIVRDGLPKSCYEFQYTLSNKLRPDCAVFLPDRRPLVIDSKFPLEAVSAYRDAKTDDERRQAAARVRTDVLK